MIQVENEYFKEVAYSAFRYALGRQTYIVSAIASFLIAHKWDLNASTKIGIIKEIRSAISEGRAGADMDIEAWQKVIDEFEGAI